MNNSHLYRQEYVRLLWVHTQQISSQSAKATEQRRTLKVQQKRKLRSLGNGFDLIKKAYLAIRHLSEVRELNSLMEYNFTKLKSDQQEEIKRLKSSWEVRYALLEVI